MGISIMILTANMVKPAAMSTIMTTIIMRHAAVHVAVVKTIIMRMTMDAAAAMSTATDC